MEGFGIEAGGTMSKWTEELVPNLQGKTIIVTGANSGIGFHTAEILARHGAKVVMACRNQEKAKKAHQEIEKQELQGSVQIAVLDLNSLDSVASFSTEMLENLEKLDGLINNAGIMMPPYQLTKDGFESQLGVNHLGHFALTARLLPLILKAEASRVVNISSLASKIGKFNFDDLHYKDGGYNPMLAYGRSKLANLLFTYELNRRFKKNGCTSISIAVHPGTTTSNLMHYLTENWLIDKLKFLSDIYTQSAYMGSLPTIRGAVDPDVSGGEYFGPRGLFGHRGYPKQVSSSKLSHDKELARHLWEASETETGLQFNFE